MLVSKPADTGSVYETRSPTSGPCPKQDPNDVEPASASRRSAFVRRLRGRPRKVRDAACSMDMPTDVQERAHDPERRQKARTPAPFIEVARRRPVRDEHVRARGHARPPRAAVRAEILERACAVLRRPRAAVDDDVAAADGQRRAGVLEVRQGGKLHEELGQGGGVCEPGVVVAADEDLVRVRLARESRERRVQFGDGA
jgi:hypothetical protein